MDEETYAIALRSALTEIQNVCEGIRWAFIFTKDGTIISGNDDKSISEEITKAASSFKNLTEKAEAVGGLDNLLIDGDKGKVYVSCIDDMYFVAGMERRADTAFTRSITGVVFPTIVRVLENIGDFGGKGPTPLKPLPLKPAEKAKKEKKEVEEPAEEVEEEKVKPLPKLPPQQLIVEKLGGMFVRADTVQVDSDVLERWSNLLDGEEIREVEIETFSGRMARCKVKEINDSKLAGKGLIRIPEKTCRKLEIKRGELVRIRPIVREK